MLLKSTENVSEYLKNFTLRRNLDNFIGSAPKTKVENISINGEIFTKYINEFWTSKQRQASSIHEISYRACFKAQLPRFFIKLFTKLLYIHSNKLQKRMILYLILSVEEGLQSLKLGY